MLCLWNAGAQDELFYLVYKLNEHAKIKIFTPFGETRMFEVDDIVKQRTTLGPILCSISTGGYCETERFFIGDTTIAPLGYVDDLASINRTEYDVLRSHESAIHFQHKKRLQLSETKCKMLTINSKKRNITTITINDNPIEHVSEFIYLGDVINSNANNKSLQRTKNVYNKMLGITAICKEICLGQYEIHVLIRLYHAIFLSTLLFNCQTWTRIRKYDIDTLAVVQLKYLMQTLRVPYSTPNVVVYLEMGLLPIEYVNDIRRFVYLHDILILTNDEPVKNCEKPVKNL